LSQIKIKLKQTGPTSYILYPSSDTYNAKSGTLTLQTDGTDAIVIDSDQKTTITGVIRGATSLWWNMYHASALEHSVGASGATLVEPGANSIGGYNLDADGEHLHVSTHVGPDWDAASDIIVIVDWEVDVDNTGGATTDEVIIKAEVYMKGETDTATKSQSLTDTVVIGKSARYKAHQSTLTIDYDHLTDAPDKGDVLVIHLSFDETNSDITDIVINHTHIKYKTAHVGIEV
jgi:hypothetical protein